ncbi:hypothetical protein N7466_004521 [Penicillium verhagenii]|uniref:uncharacterized protein n=1 Tax=Penicillium verhagenii TaxID=1562060 RepID=UPI00254518E0|nr:uncharacterized protein N7466_004521 [Penicillium verhagenii]KAJ5934974.1 hypothetical protein N7466_004521 [Penicillium verhagenii]
MFEDFSFSSPSSRPTRLALSTEDRLMIDGDSNLISPLSSRCPSPTSHRFRTLSRSRSSYFRSQQQQQQPPPTSVPFPYESKRLSIATLTQKLHEHTLQTPNGESFPDRTRFAPHANNPADAYGSARSAPYAGWVLTPPDTDHDDDGHLSSPSLCSNPSPTSIPPDFPLLDGPDLPHPQPDLLSIRSQRQQISQLQCSNQGDIDAIRRAANDDSYGSSLPSIPCEDDCHPSSLPPRPSPRRRALTQHRSRFGPAESLESRGRRKSSAGAIQSHRIEKSHHPSFAGREASKRNEQGLRRKSMVTAALASVAERP